MSQCPSVPIKRDRPHSHSSYDSFCGRIYCEDKHSFLQDCEDDGETAAGGRLLHLLQVIIQFIKVSPTVVMWPVLSSRSIPLDIKVLFLFISSLFSRHLMLLLQWRVCCPLQFHLNLNGFFKRMRPSYQQFHSFSFMLFCLAHSNSKKQCSPPLHIVK